MHSIDPRCPDLPYRCRQQYHAMVMVMDEMVGNITAAFKAKGMWERTLMVMSSEYVHVVVATLPFSSVRGIRFQAAKKAAAV